MDIPENFFAVSGEEDITIQTVTWPDVEMPLPQNITEGEARGNVILTVKPIFGVSPTILEPGEPFTSVPGVGTTAFPEAENETGAATRPWGVPEESTPGLGPITAFTSEDLVVQVTTAPEVPGQPRLPGGKCPAQRGLHAGQGKWKELGLGVYTWDLGLGTWNKPLSSFVKQGRHTRPVTFLLLCHKAFPSNGVMLETRVHIKQVKMPHWVWI